MLASPCQLCREIFSLFVRELTQKKGSLSCVWIHWGDYLWLARSLTIISSVTLTLGVPGNLERKLIWIISPNPNQCWLKLFSKRSVIWYAVRLFDKCVMDSSNILDENRAEFVLGIQAVLMSPKQCYSILLILGFDTDIWNVKFIVGKNIFIWSEYSEFGASKNSIKHINAYTHAQPNMKFQWIDSHTGWCNHSTKQVSDAHSYICTA